MGGGSGVISLRRPVDCLLDPNDEFLYTWRVGMDACPKWAAYTESSKANFFTRSVTVNSDLIAHRSFDAVRRVRHIEMRNFLIERILISDVSGGRRLLLCTSCRSSDDHSPDHIL